MLAIKIFFAVLIIICAVFYVMYLWDFALVLLIVIAAIPVVMFVLISPYVLSDKGWTNGLIAIYFLDPPHHAGALYKNTEVPLMEPPLISGKTGFFQTRNLRDLFPDLSQSLQAKHRATIYGVPMPEIHDLVGNYQSRGFIVGNSSTSRMESELVSSITRRSMPKPRPPVGGMPYSRALT